MMKRATVVAAFENRQQAQQAVEELRRKGFRDDEIGIVAQDTQKGESATTDEKTGHAETRAIAGAVAGAGVGTLWGLGIMAGLLPAIGPVIAGGTLAAILASAATGAAAAGLAGALIGLGIPEEEARYYESEFKSGRILVTVKADGRYDEAREILRRLNGYEHQSGDRSAVSGESCATATGSKMAAGSQTVQAREEELRVRKQPVQAGEVRVHKEVHTEHRTLDVPVKKEEVVVERVPATGRNVAATDIREGADLRVPVMEEEVHIEKQPVVKEEVRVSKREVEDTKQVGGTVRKEEIKVEKEGKANVRDERRGR